MTSILDAAASQPSLAKPLTVTFRERRKVLSQRPNADQVLQVRTVFIGNPNGNVAVNFSNSKVLLCQ